MSLLSIYPVESIYMSENDTNPSELFGGEWEQVSKGRALFGAGELNGISYVANSNIDAGLPNIIGSIGNYVWADSELVADGGFSINTSTTKTRPAAGSSQYLKGISFNASRYNSIYGNSETVQPNAYVVYMWKRNA